MSIYAKKIYWIGPRLAVARNLYSCMNATGSATRKAASTQCLCRTTLTHDTCHKPTPTTTTTTTTKTTMIQPERVIEREGQSKIFTRPLPDTGVTARKAFLLNLRSVSYSARSRSLSASCTAPSQRLPAAGSAKSGSLTLSPSWKSTKTGCQIFCGGVRQQRVLFIVVKIADSIFRSG